MTRWEPEEEEFHLFPQLRRERQTVQEMVFFFLYSSFFLTGAAVENVYTHCFVFLCDIIEYDDSSSKDSTSLLPCTC